MPDFDKTAAGLGLHVFYGPHAGVMCSRWRHISYFYTLVRLACIELEGTDDAHRVCANDFSEVCKNIGHRYTIVRRHSCKDMMKLIIVDTTACGTHSRDEHIGRETIVWLEQGGSNAYKEVKRYVGHLQAKRQKIYEKDVTALT